MKIREIEQEIIALHAQADACLASAGDMLKRMHRKEGDV